MPETSREVSDKARSGRDVLAVWIQMRRAVVVGGTSASFFTGVCATRSNVVPIGSAAGGSGLQTISSAVSEARSRCHTSGETADMAGSGKC